MKTYVFRVVVEPDEDKWAVHCPALLKYAAISWGDTQEEDYLRPFTHEDSPEIEEALRRWDRQETQLLNTIASEEAILEDMYEEYEREEN